MKKIKSEPISTYGFSHGLMYTFKMKRLVCFGLIDKKLSKAFDVKAAVFAADFNWDLVLEIVGYNKTTYKENSRFPIVRRDLSLLLDENVQFSQLKTIAQQTENKIHGNSKGQSSQTTIVS